jgi:exopolysaccharide biosynthesis polyprenyl glycosylphosphotransferase
LARTAGLPVSLDERTAALHRRSHYQAGLKVAIDTFFSLLILLATLPLWLAIAIAIKIDSDGPVFIAQERVGYHGRRFRMYKFRSMCADAERKLEILRALNEVDGPVFKIRKDPRVTRVGRILRPTSLDELPQLINVLKGDMSLVGPRPPLPRETERYRPADWLRLRARPGLTCLWQINGRSECSFERWMEYDRTYIEQMSLGLDLLILVKTVWVVLTLRGAY